MAIRDAIAHWQPESEGSALWQKVVGDLLSERALETPQAPALIYEDETRTLTLDYKTLDEQTDRLARALLSWGVNRGDHVAVLSANSPEWVLLEYALAKIGAVLVTVNTALKQDELSYIFRQGAVSTLFYTSEFRGYDIAGAVANLREGLADLKRYCILDGQADGALPFDTLLAKAEGTSVAALKAVRAEVKPNDIAQIQFTSGTTGAPKGAMLTHIGILNNARFSAARGRFGPSDRLLSPMPLFHTAGCVCNVLGMLACGGALVLMPAFDADRMLDLMIKYKATIINAVPTMYIRMLEALKKRDNAPAIWPLKTAFTGGTSIPPSMMRDLYEKFGAKPMIIMGMTEASPIITQTRPSDDFEQQIATAGVPLAHTEIKIIDPETGETAKCGKPENC